MADDSASSPNLHICALCTASARYKCPRCAVPTCSLPCSRKHKQDTRCTGERDKARYVPMNAYGWGTMMRDYCYLEGVGRKVSEWGCEIVRGGYTSASKAAGTQRSTSRKRQTTGKSKRDLLRAHLETLGIDIELLPAGMERRNLNQSTFDQKSKNPLLTVEFVFHPPSFISPAPPPPYKILSHRIGLSAPLLSILQRQVSSALAKSQRQKENTPDWLLPVVTPHPEAPECFLPPHCYVLANTEFPCPPNTVYYHKLDPALNLHELLEKTSFVEFPTIHVFDPNASSFFGVVINKSGSMISVSEDGRTNAREAKRRKLNKTVGSQAVFNLIGGYGSEASSHSEEGTTNKHPTGLATLEAYLGSDDDETHTDAEEDQSNSDVDIREEGNHLDPQKLLELVKQAQIAAEEDRLDWGDDWDTE